MKKKRENKPRKPAAHAPPMDEVEAAYQRTEPELHEIPAERVGRVTTDVPTAVSLVLGSYSLLEGLVPAMKEHLKHPPLDALGRLRDRSHALLYAHLRWVPRTPASHEADLEEARVLREQLLATADAHVTLKQMDAEAVASIREGSGYLDRASDLIALATLFRASRSRITNTPVTEVILERATALGTQLVGELGSKTLGVGEVGGGVRNWADRRNRAFRLFMDDYDQIRRAVEYLRYFEEDASTFAPPLHRRRGSAPVEPPVEPTPPVA